MRVCVFGLVANRNASGFPATFLVSFLLLDLSIVVCLLDGVALIGQVKTKRTVCIRSPDSAATAKEIPNLSI